MVPLIDGATGEQRVDLATGLPMWLMPDDASGLVVLGMACAVQTPTFLPATGDGSTVPFVEDYSDAVPYDHWGYAEY